MESGARRSAHVNMFKARGKVTREAIVVAVCKLVVEKDWYRSEFVHQSTGQGSSVCFRNLHARPAVPYVRYGVRQATDAADQSA